MIKIDGRRGLIQGTSHEVLSEFGVLFDAMFDVAKDHSDDVDEDLSNMATDLALVLVSTIVHYNDRNDCNIKLKKTMNQLQKEAESMLNDFKKIKAKKAAALDILDKLDELIEELKDAKEDD